VEHLGAHVTVNRADESIMADVVDRPVGWTHQQVRGDLIVAPTGRACDCWVAGHRLANRRAPARLIPGSDSHPGFDVTYSYYDTSATIRLRSPS
jgi:hypothetical protein